MSERMKVTIGDLIKFKEERLGVQPSSFDIEEETLVEDAPEQIEESKTTKEIEKAEVNPEEVNLDALGWTQDQIETGLVNSEGDPTFERNNYERTIQVLTTNTMENTFYVRKEEIEEQTLEVLEEMAQSDPEFLAKALVYAREEGLLQLAPTYGLAVLSKAEDKDYFKTVFPRIVTTPDNLMKFAEICKSGKVREGLGGVATKAVKKWLGNLSEYQALKYSGDSPTKMKDGKVAKNNFSLRDLIVMARPKPESEEEAERFNWLVTRHHDEDKLAHNERIANFEALKKAETDEDRVELIKNGGLPWEVVIPSVPKMTPEIWQALMPQMPYMALLRNIRNLEKNGVLQDEENVQYIVDRLTDAEAIGKAKILPFRFYEAYSAYTGKTPGERDYDYYDEEFKEKKEKVTDSRIEKALEEALELSFINLPEIPGTVAIGSDVSGSMSSPISSKGKTRYIDVCGVYTGALLKKIPERAIPLPFEHEIVDINLSAEDRILETTEKIASVGGGGTAVGAPIEKLLRTGTKVDHFIGITDNEDWAYGEGYGCYSGGSFLKNWREYRATVNPDAQAYLITIAPYRDAVAPQNEPGVHFIYGWSDKVPGLISNLANGQESQVEKVNNIKL